MFGTRLQDMKNWSNIQQLTRGINLNLKATLDHGSYLEYLDQLGSVGNKDKGQHLIHTREGTKGNTDPYLFIKGN